MISSWEIQNIRHTITDILYAGDSQLVRLEWLSQTAGESSVYAEKAGGSADVLTTGYNPYFDETPQTISGNKIYLYTETGVPANIHIADDWDVKAYDNQKLMVGDAIIMLATSVNLAKRDRVMIVHCLDTEKVSGTGTGSSATWTDTSASWTTNQYKGMYLIFSDRRFLITANTATTLTVNLDGFTLPSSGSYTIQACVVWKSKYPNPSLGDGLDEALGDDMGAQTIVCERVSAT
jgi:hypothetical protein